MHLFFFGLYLWFAWFLCPLSLLEVMDIPYFFKESLYSNKRVLDIHLCVEPLYFVAS